MDLTRRTMISSSSYFRVQIVGFSFWILVRLETAGSQVVAALTGRNPSRWIVFQIHPLPAQKINECQPAAHLGIIVVVATR